MFRMLASTCVVITSLTPALAQPDGDQYVLGLPVGLGDDTPSEFCVDGGGSAYCEILEAPPGFMGSGGPVRFLFDSGSIEDLRQTYDFVPWPWSRKPSESQDLAPDVFGGGTAAPVLFDECQIMTCARGSSCVRNSEHGFPRARCEPMEGPHPIPLGGVLPVGTIWKLEGTGDLPANLIKYCASLPAGTPCIHAFMRDYGGGVIWTGQ